MAARLVEGSLYGGLLIALVWLVCRMVSMPPKARAVLWWMASAKLILSVLALPGVPLRVLPAQGTMESRVLLQQRALSSTGDPAEASAGVSRDPVVSGVDHVASTALTDSLPAHVSATDVLTGLWCAVVFAYVAALVVAGRRVRGLVAAGRPVSAAEANDVASLAARLGVRRVPRVLTHAAIVTPQAVGVVRPAILLPADFAQRVTASEWRMAVCHELMHVRRQDLLWGWIPAIAERLFFFHPLARLASEHYLIAREAACDAAVVDALDVDVHDYGRMLLRLGVARTMPGFAASGASPTVSSLRRRIEMLHQISASGTSRARGLLVAAAAVALLPFHLAAQAPARQVSPAARTPTPAAVTSTAVAELLERERAARDHETLALTAAAQADAARLEQRRLEAERQVAGAVAGQAQVDQQTLRDRAVEAERIAQELALQMERLKAQLQGAPRETRRVEDAAPNLADTKALEETIARLTEQQALLSQRLTEQHPDLIEVQRALAAMQSQLQQQGRAPQPNPSGAQATPSPGSLAASARGADVAEEQRLRQKVSDLEREVERLKLEIDALKRSRPAGGPRSDAGRPALLPGSNGFSKPDLDRAMDALAGSLPKVFETAMRSTAADALRLRGQLMERYQDAHPDRQSLDIALTNFQQRLLAARPSTAAATRASSESMRQQVQAALADMQQAMSAIRTRVSPMDDVLRSAQLMNGLRDQQRLLDERKRELEEVMKRVLERTQQNQSR
jgi:beta-lactamase regulating signal transducer with metallopeptidase domain